MSAKCFGSRVARSMILAGVVLLAGLTGQAYGHLGGDECVALGGTIVSGQCEISSAVAASSAAHGGFFALNETLRITGAGSITVPPAPGGNALTLQITGDLIMDLPTITGGSRIAGDVFTASGVGATITVNATNGIVLMGSSSTGAQISSDQGASSCGGGRGGNISLNAGAAIDIQAGSQVTSMSVCPGGAIDIIAGLSATIDGLVLSGGTARTVSKGGPITIKAGCDLTIGNTGKVTSLGKDPGADLVHLEGGCSVAIFGLVASTGPGHSISAVNRCNGSFRPGKPAGSHACVEVWSGGPLEINSVSPHNGEVNADTAQSGGTVCCAWVDLFARGNVNIVGDSSGAFAVHANQFLTNGSGGLITVKSTEGNVSASRLAIQANATAGASRGGVVTAEASGAFHLDTAVIQAQGDFNSSGGFGIGGTISASAFNGNLTWTSGTGDVRPTGSQVPPASDGQIFLQACDPVTLGASFPVNGAADPGFPTVGPVTCGGAPTLPSYVTLPSCTCLLPGPPSTGHLVVNKVTCPANDPTGFSITATGTGTITNGSATRTLSTSVAVDYEVTPGTFSVSEVVPSGWTQTGNTCNNVVVTAGQTATCTMSNTNTTSCSAPFSPSFCPVGTVQAVLDPQTGRFPGNRGPDVVVDVRTQSLQNALDTVTDANGDGYIIIGVIAADNGAAGGQGNQEVQINKHYDKPFALIGCHVTVRDLNHCNNVAPIQVTSSAGSPEFPLGSGVTLYIQEITAVNSDSAPGWVIDGNGRFLEAVGSQGNLLGFQITGDGNTVHNSFANNNLGGGLTIKGNGNTVDTVQVLSNAGGDGIQVTGNGNQVLNSTAGDAQAGNGGNGITVNGKGNCVLGNFAFQNGADGINVSGGTAASAGTLCTGGATAGTVNVVRGNVSGSPQRGGNAGNGIALGGTGNGGVNPIELEANSTRDNSLDGIKVTGTGHQLKNNQSGGAGSSTNGVCQYDVVAGNINATGNMIGSTAIPGANGSPFPAGCQ